MDTLTGEPIPTRTLSRTPLSRAIRERLTDEPSAKSVPWHPAPVELDESKITRGDSATSDESQTDPPESGPKLSISASPPQGEASIPRASAAASTGRLLAPTHGDLSGLVFEVFECSKHGQDLQAVDVPHEMATTPQTVGRVATHDCSLTSEWCIRR